MNLKQPLAIGKMEEIRERKREGNQESEVVKAIVVKERQRSDKQNKELGKDLTVPHHNFAAQRSYLKLTWKVVYNGTLMKIFFSIL